MGCIAHTGTLQLLCKADADRDRQEEPPKRVGQTRQGLVWFTNIAT